MTIKFERLSFLLIEDSATFLAAIEKMLNELKIKKLDSASKADKAVQLLQDNKYDVVLCDYNLQDSMNGQQILEIVRFENLLKHTSAFVMVTGDPDIENLTTSTEARADDYIIKPVSFDLLKKHLTYVIDFKSRVADALKAIDNQKYDDAQKKCDKVIQEKREYVLPVLRIKAEIYIRKGEYKKAQNIYRKILEHKNIPWAQFGLAQTHHLLEEYEEAEKILENVIRYKNNFTIAYDWLAKVQIALDEKPEALETLQRAISIAPNSLIRQMAAANIANELKEYEVAARSFKRAISLGKNSCYKTPGIYLSLAKVLLAKADIDESISESEKKQILNLTNEARTVFKKEKLVQIESYLFESQLHSKLEELEQQGEAVQLAFELYNNSKALNDNQRAKAAILFHKYAETQFAQAIVNTIAENNKYTGSAVKIISPILKNTPKSQEADKLFEQGNLKAAYQTYLQALQACPSSIAINLKAIHALLAFAEKTNKFGETLDHCRQCFANINKSLLTKSQLDKLEGLKARFKSLSS